MAELPSNLINSTSAEKSPVSKKTKSGFRGTFAIKILHDKVESGEISPVAAWLAMIIHSLSRGSRGCFASNKYLGQKIHRSVKHVTLLMIHLEKAGILKSIWIGKTRQLKLDPDGKSKLRRKDVYQTDARDNQELLTEWKGVPIEIDQLKTMPYIEYLKTEHWEQMRKKALEYAEKKCQLCNKSKNLEVHHRTYERRGCELITDLTVLCRFCHQKHHDITPTGGGNS